MIAGTRVPVGVILDCLAAGMTTEEITAEYSTVTTADVRAAAAYGAALAARTGSRCRSRNEVQARREPAGLAAILASAGHDADTVIAEHLAGAPDPDVVTAACTAGRLLITLDRGMGDIRAGRRYPRTHSPSAAAPSTGSYPR